MQAKLCCRWLLVFFLMVSPCFLVTYARGGRGGGGRSSSRSSSRPSPSYSRPSPSYSRPAPAPAPSYSQTVPKPPPFPPSASKPSAPDVVRQPAYNPNFKESNSGYGAGDKQPAYNPNYKPDNSKPAGPPPPYSPVGHPVPNAPVGPPPSYQSSNQQSGSFGKLPSGQPAPYPQQPPPYPGQPGRPPAYPGLSSSYPAQPGSQPYPRQPSYSGDPHQPQLNRPYAVQPGYPGVYQPNIQRPYAVQPGLHNPYPGVNRPYPQQSLGGNVWQPHYGMPAPSYMNYGGIPTGTNMHTKPHKKKGFIGSLMSLGKNKPEKKNKYYGSYPSPYGIGSSGINHGGGGFLGKHGSSAAKYSIFPYMAARKAHKIHRPKFGFFPGYTPQWHHYHHHHHYHRQDYDGEIEPKYAMYFDLYNESYVGKCQQPLKKKHKVNCSATFDELQCVAKCEEGYRFPNGTKSVTNKCWHVTGVWKPKKNYPECLPVCNDVCLNGGECIAPEVCKCPVEYRGSQCQFHFLKCNILSLVKEENLSWTCKHYKTETVCNIKCKNSAEFDLSPPVEYKCTPDGVWIPDTLPHCDVDKS